MSVLARGVALAMLVACAHGPVEANLIQNGDFSGGGAFWSIVNPCMPSVSGGVGFVVSRQSLEAGFTQNITPSLAPEDNGRCVVTSFRIKLSGPTAVRLVLRVTEDGTQRDVVLAEQVVRETGVWSDVSGSWRLSWSGNLDSAQLRLQAGHKTRDVQSLAGGGLFPDLEVDDFRVEFDDDCDGVANTDESVLGTFPDSMDSDDDGMPDGWERDHGTDPTTKDGHLDGDSDQSDNLEEFWAATNPLDVNSYPGRPANPNLSLRGRSLLRYMARLPANGLDNHALLGQHLTTPTTEYISYIEALANEPNWGRWVSVIALQYDDGALPPDTVTANSYASAYWKAGGLVEIKWNPRHPWTQGFYSYCPPPNNTPPCPTPDEVDIPALLAPVTDADLAANAFFLGELDAVAAGLAELRDLDIPVLWRFSSEMNGGHFWWGMRARQDYINYWRFIFNYLTDPHGWNLNNLIWVYESDASAHPGLPVDYYYPGDDFVDVVGNNLYHPTFRMDFQFNEIWARYPKVYAAPQTGPDKANREGDFSNLNYLYGTDGTSGLVHQLRRISYFSLWNSFNQGGVQHNIAIIDNPDAESFLTDSYVVTRDELPGWLHSEPASSADWWLIY